MGDLRLRATICTNRSPAEVRETLAAVCRQAAAVGAEALLVTSGVEPGARDEHERQASELGARSAFAGAGLAVARNLAVDELPEPDVVAFLDDDVIPQPDWLQRLAAHWQAAPREVACIGGAILPRWEGEPPRWLGPGLATSFSLLDLGPGTVELTPSRGFDAWGANVSFRLEALRRIGGFDPALGAWDGVPLFGEESDAELRLERAGMRVIYAGDVRVEHRIPRARMTLRALARRERWRGVTLVRTERRRPHGGAPRALKAAAGSALALARLDRHLAAERWARAWRELGVAAAPLALRRLRRRGWPG
jgi:glucosyl-dolichyl phosphate glucuronosyltransferase